jgi:hypothetical protein
VNLSWLRPVQTYLLSVITLGISVLTGGALYWRCEDPRRFAAYLLLACCAGAFKVRMPGMTGTYSLTFLFVLIGVVDLTFPETVFIAASSMIVQCGWRPAISPAPIQIVFNAASVAVAAAAAYLIAHLVAAAGFVVSLLLAAVVYFLINTFLVAGVLAQVEHRRFVMIWREWFRLSLTYYTAGVVVAGIMIASNRHFGWMFSLLALPLMYLEYVCYRLKVDDDRAGENANALRQ